MICEISGLVAETAGVHAVLRLANAMNGILLDDAEFHWIGENSAEETDVRDAVLAPPRTIARPRSLSVLTFARVLPDMMSFMGLGDVGLGQSRTHRLPSRRNDAALDAPVIGGDRRGFLRTASFAEHKPIVQIFEVAGAEFVDGDRLAIELVLLGRVPTACDLAEQDLRLLRGPNPVRADRVATRAAGSAMLHGIASLSPA